MPLKDPQVGDTVTWRVARREFRARVKAVEGDTLVLEFVRHARVGGIQWTLESDKRRMSASAVDLHVRPEKKEHG